MDARIVVGGVGSDVGKTTICVGLMGALARRGLHVQGFKVGPDYIDPTYHALVTGRPSRNLDTWLMGERGVLCSFKSAMKDADVGVVEGVMGLFDGSSPTQDSQSTCELARILRAPVILVVDVGGMARSAAAVVLGFSAMARGCGIKGVILNRVGSEGHASMCKRAIEELTGIPVVGAVKVAPQIELQSRHLGLHLAFEGMEEKVKELVNIVERSVDLDAILNLAGDAPQLNAPTDCETEQCLAGTADQVKVGVAFDDAFAFYYEDNFETLRALGAQLVFFSPSADKTPPDVDALYIGGGYPELKAEVLEANSSMKHHIKRMVEDELPVYSECGGLMYLSREIEGFEGAKHKMVGVFDLDTVLTKRLTIGYTELEGATATSFTAVGECVRGHEFHYSEARNISSDCRFAYKIKRGRGITGDMDGSVTHKALGSYSHVHFLGHPKLPARMLEAAKERRRR